MLQLMGKQHSHFSAHFFFCYILDITILANGTLHIHNTSTKDAGVYICIGRNNAGYAVGRIRLKVLGK